MSVRMLLGSILLACSLTAQAADHGKDHGAGIVVKLEGKEHKLDKIDWAASTVTIEGDEVRYYFTQDRNPFSVNFNLSNTKVMEKGSVEFMLPEDNRGGMTIDLNFFDQERQSNRSAKRLIFRQGTISITEISPKVLRMTFKGSGHPLMKSMENFPMEGSIDIRFP